MNRKQISRVFWPFGSAHRLIGNLEKILTVFRLFLLSNRFATSCFSEETKRKIFALGLVDVWNMQLAPESGPRNGKDPRL